MTVPLDTVNDIRSMDAAGLSRPEAARALHVSRNTVAKYADMEDMSPAAPMPRRRGRPAPEGNEEWVAGVLEVDLGAPRKQRHTARRIYDRLVAERGYAGPWAAARRFVRGLRLARAAAGGEGCLEPGWAPGACQVDFGNLRAAVGGRALDPRLLVATLPHPNDRQCVALMSQRSGGRARSPPPSWRSGRGSAPRNRWSTWRATSRRRGPAARPRGARRCSGAARCRRPRPSAATAGRPRRGRRAWGASRCSRSTSSGAGRASCSWATSAPARRTWRRPSARRRARGGSRRASPRRPRP